MRLLPGGVCMSRLETIVDGCPVYYDHMGSAYLGNRGSISSKTSVPIRDMVRNNVRSRTYICT